jgi:hypothetical protein
VHERAAGRQTAKRAVEDRADDRDAAGYAELLGGGEDARRRAGPFRLDVHQHGADQGRQGEALAEADQRGGRREFPAGQVRTVARTGHDQSGRAEGGQQGSERDRA